MPTVTVVPDVSFGYRNIFFGSDAVPTHAPIIVGAAPWDDDLDTYTKTWTTEDGLTKFTHTRGDFASALATIGDAPITSCVCHITVEYGADNHSTPPRLNIIMGDPFGGGVNLLCPASTEPGTSLTFWSMAGYDTPESYDTDLWSTGSGAAATIEEIDAAFKQGFIYVQSPSLSGPGESNTWAITYALSLEVTYATTRRMPPRRGIPRHQLTTAPRGAGGRDSVQDGPRGVGAVI